jgi:hypothetical protein
VIPEWGTQWGFSRVCRLMAIEIPHHIPTGNGVKC